MVYVITNKGALKKDFVLRDHMRKTAISAVSNIAEGFETIPNLEFCRFLNFSVRSLTELQSHLYVSFDVGHLNETEFQEVFALITKCRQVCKGMARYLRNNVKRQHAVNALNTVNEKRRLI